MKAFNGDESFKQALLAEVEKHRIADQIVKGTYGDMMDKNFKGCAVGCSIHSYALLNNLKVDTSDHGSYETMFGIPRILARLEDRIFEELPIELAKTWPERFFSAINPGADLTKVWPKFAIWLLIDAEHGVIRYASYPDTRSAIQRVAELYASSGTKEEFRKARSDAAHAAAHAAHAAHDAARQEAYKAYIAQSEKLLELMAEA